MADTENHMADIKKGMLFGGAAAVIWGAWPVVTSLGVDAAITPYQLVLLRFFIAGPLLLPWALKGPHRLADWLKILVFAIFAGIPYSFVVSSGFQYASATHAGVIIPGTIMLTSLIGSHLFLGDKMHRFRLIGGGAILAGLWLLAVGAPETAAASQSLTGDLMFFTGGLMWATYTMLLRVWPVDPIMVTARVAFVSLLLLTVLFPVLPDTGFGTADTNVVLLQGLWQGVISSVLALVLFNRGVALMGPARASVTNAIIPVISTILAFLILSEVPTTIEAMGLASILTGIGIAMFMAPKKKALDATPQKI